MRVLLACVLFAAFAVSCWSATIDVPDDYSTIPLAIAAANPLGGDTIVVAPGTYYGSIIINKPLTLQSSAGAASTILNGNHANEHYYMVNIKADDVVVDGFTITNPIYAGTADVSGVLTGSDGHWSNIRVANCIIHDLCSPTRNAPNGTFGINVGPVDGLELANNEVYNIKHGSGSRARGIFTWGNDYDQPTVNVNIHHNEIHDIGSVSAGTGDGIHVGFLGGDMSVTDNTVYNTYRYGIAVYGYGYELGPVTATDNDITTAAGGIGIHVSSPLADVSDNDISGSGSGMVFSGVTTGPGFDIGTTTFAAGLSWTVRLAELAGTSGTTVDVDATGVIFGGAKNGAEIEAKVWHDVDDPLLGHVEFDANQLSGNILAWDKTDQKFYLTADPSDPATGALVVSGTTYYYGGQPLTVTVTGPPGDQSAVVDNASAANYLRVRWTMLGANLYRAYGWSQTAAADSLVFQRGMTYVYSDPGWDPGYWGFNHTCSHNGTTWDLTKDLDQQP